MRNLNMKTADLSNYFDKKKILRNQTRHSYSLGLFNYSILYNGLFNIRIIMAKKSTK